MRRYLLRQFLKNTASVFGATMGEAHRAPLVCELEADPIARDLDGPGEIVVLDFDGIESATASYLKATLLWLLGRSGSAASSVPDAANAPLNVYPVVAGLNAEVSGELDELLRGHGRSCLELVRMVGDEILSARLRGPLDKTLRETLAILTEAGCATATELHQRYPQERPITVTAWNNRLSDLTTRRLARRTRQGRQWLYQALSREVSDG